MVSNKCILSNAFLELAWYLGSIGQTCVHTECFLLCFTLRLPCDKSSSVDPSETVRMHHAQIKTQCALAGWLLVNQVTEAIGGSAVESGSVPSGLKKIK